MIVITGNLGADPELRFTKDGAAVANLRVAVTKRVKQDDGTWADGDTTWFSVKCWRGLAENAAESLTKGSRVIVYGEMKSRSYEDKDGGKQTAWEIEATDIGPSLTNQAAKLEKVNSANKVDRSLAALGATPVDAWAEPAQAEAAPF